MVYRAKKNTMTEQEIEKLNNEFSNEFDVLYNNITSNQAPGLDEYEKSVFLTKAQDEIVKAYFNPKTNKVQEGFDGNEKRQIDFSMIMRSDSYSKITAVVRPDLFASTISSDNLKDVTLPIVSSGILKKPYNIYDSQVSVITRPGVTIDYEIKYIPKIDIIDRKLPYQAVVSDGTKYEASIDRNIFDVSKSQIVEGDNKYEAIIANPFTSSFFDLRNNTKAVTLNSDILMFVNEYVEVTRNNQTVRLTVLPINYTEYSRLMSKPYKRPLKNQSWRLLDNSDGTKKAELVIGPGDEITKYVIRYVKRPRAIRLTTFDDVTLDGGNTAQCCELDPILFPEIIQRACELAKAAYTGDLQSQLALGQTSQTNMGIITQSR